MKPDPRAAENLCNDLMLPESGLEQEVQRRYGQGAINREQGLCCPTEYEDDLLAFLPPEIVAKDYGCGDPSRYVRRGETVLDLGSGAGKICYILAQKVGSAGSVLGVDFNDEMLTLARSYQDEVAEKLGYQNVQFLKGKIQDLALDLELAQKWLDAHPVATVEDVSAFEAECERLRKEHMLIPAASVDVVVSNCVLNLVRPQDKDRLFAEIFRVLKRGGRAVISDIVCDEDPTPSMLADPGLWSGCIAGAFREDKLLEAFEQAGFYGIAILARQTEPWQVIEGIEFRSLTVQAFKGKEGPCLERNQAVIYTGPWRCVCDDDNHTFYRGRRMAVCDKTFAIMSSPTGPYSSDIVPVAPIREVPMEEAGSFDCNRSSTRHPRETKGEEYTITKQTGSDPCCGPDCC